jgi:hypothetical protein
MSVFSDMRSVLHEYGSTKGSDSELNERMTLMCNAPAVSKMKQEARSAQRSRTKTTHSLSNQITVLTNDSKILPLSELVAQTLAYCNRVWAHIKSRVTAITNGYKKATNTLTCDERTQLAGLFLTVHYLTVKVERNCNMVSLKLDDGIKWLTLDVLIHTQHKPSCMQAFSLFGTTPQTKTFLTDYIYLIRPALCLYDRLITPKVDERDLVHLQRFLSLSSTSWIAYTASRNISTHQSRIMIIFDTCKPVGGVCVPDPSSNPLPGSELADIYKMSVGGEK